jgi:RES domain-containing protein
VEVFRLANTLYASLDGSGGLHGNGRWHHTGYRVTYAGSSRALAVLERFVHDKNSLTVPDLQMITIHIPDEMVFVQRFEQDLPKRWDTTDNDNQQATQNIGTDFLKDNVFAFLKTPSAIVPHEYNYVLNPLHPDASRITIVDAHNYQYDERYKRIIKA